MTPTICLALCLAFQADDTWKFRDETQRDGRFLVAFRALELTGTPGTPLHVDDRPPSGAKYGTIALGPEGKLRLGAVYHEATSTVWLNADGDGRFSPAERFVLGAKAHEFQVKIPFGEMSSPRTLLVRKRGSGLAYAVQGYTEGAVRLNGKRVAALLTDGDADGCFDGAGTDRVWLDLDGDGKFDALTEQFALGTVVNHAGTSYLIRPRPDGLAVDVHQRPAEFGALNLGMSKLPGASIVELSAQLVSEWGELVTVKDLDKPLNIPIGKYRVDSVRVKLAGPDRKVWHYGFSANNRAFNIEIAPGKQTKHLLLEGLKMTVALDSALAAPGSSVLVHAHLETTSGLFMTHCGMAERYASYEREIQATLKLTAPGSEVLDQAMSGFH